MSKAEKNSPTPTTPTTPIPPNVTKLCHIIKREDFDGYGFNLHSEKVKPGQFIGKVDADSPALHAGLKEGDRIIEVNGVPIGNESHKQVVQRIKALSNEVRLLLIDVDGKGDAPKSPTKMATSPNSCSTEAKKTCEETVDAEEMKKPELPKSMPPMTPPRVTSATEEPVHVMGNGVTHTEIHSEEYHGTKMELPGESSNISSISMVSVKRMSSISSGSNHSSILSSDVVDKGLTASSPPMSIKSLNHQIVEEEVPKHQHQHMVMPLPDLNNGTEDNNFKATTISINNNNNNDDISHSHNDNNNTMISNNNHINNMDKNFEKMVMPPMAPIIDPPPPNGINNLPSSTPPPPSSITASHMSSQQSKITSNGSLPMTNGSNSTTQMSTTSSIITTTNNNNNIQTTTTHTQMSSTSPPSATTGNGTTNGNGMIRAGSLNLPMTAAEMRAKLLSKKKYDPKQESVDLRKKFEIIQKL